MRSPEWLRSVGLAQSETWARPSSARDRFAIVLALVTIVGLATLFVFSKGTSFLMPGPLASAHGTIEKCSTCHTKSGSGQLSWVRGLVAADSHADSKACLTCHKMPETAFNAHSAPSDVLQQSTERLTKIAVATPQPQSARAQSFAFPTMDLVAGGVTCATCHQEHQGVNFNLNKISDEQCRSCHVVKFDSFDGNHPTFDSYPFKRRTRIVYDHAGHFGKHFPEVAKKDAAKRIPETCSTCHNSREDKLVMAVESFDKTCSTCHLDQITGKERVSGPKGIAFLSLPGLDLESLKKKNAAIGEWPDASEAALTPFMKVMISRNARARALLQTVDSLNLQDLSTASDEQIEAVTDLAWEIKSLFYKLISDKASDALGDLNIGSGAKLSPALVADLTASIPRDVIISAQQQWLPNLATEMASRQVTSEQDRDGWSTVTKGSPIAVSASPAPSAESDPVQAAASVTPDVSGGADTAPAAGGEWSDTATAASDSSGDSSPDSGTDGGDQTASTDTSSSNEPDPADDTAANEAKKPVKFDPPACVVRVLGQCLVSNGSEGGTAQPKGAAGKTDAAKSKAANSNETSSADKMPPAMRAGLRDVMQAADADVTRANAKAAHGATDSGRRMVVAENQPASKSAGQSDDLLYPTEEELREMKALNAGGGAAAGPPEVTGKAGTSNAPPEAGATIDAEASAGVPTARSQTAASPVISIESTVDAESWADYGGWYRQDFAMFYRPAGHKDKFIYSWLFLTGPQALKAEASPAGAVFDYLTNKDAQGSCTKCHSVDDIKSKGRLVNFAPLSIESKQGRFTSFVHEPHFGTMDDRGCLTCHTLEKDRAYLKSYEQGNPQSFAANFGAVKKDLCQTCHSSTKARQDCLLCHKYHVNDAITPIMTTKVPTQ